MTSVVETAEVELDRTAAAARVATDAGRMAARKSEGLSAVVVVSVDNGLRQRLAAILGESRWLVLEAQGGAEAMLRLESHRTEAMVIDSWLPDLEVGEFISHVRLLYPAVELLRVDGTAVGAQLAGRSLQHAELVHAIRAACADSPVRSSWADLPAAAGQRTAEAYRLDADGFVTDGSLPGSYGVATGLAARGDGLPELVGSSEAMHEVARLVEMVAPRATPVLIEGETGTGKEVVARALHRLSRRAAKPFVVLNCAAIPESLLEAELFGHARGAFTGAVQSRMGRIESANGGTLLLDEIGEMPLGMQAKMLRFIESGELQKVGENEVVRVDVRLIAATHQPLEQRSAEGTFRLDLYHRLVVFPIEVPALRERMEDIPELAEHFLERMGRDDPRKRLTREALDRLQQHLWPGNVRELMHVLERGAILAGTQPEIGAAEIRFRRRPRVSVCDAL
jgi:DNA-binding NtrC family response regulator